MTILNRIFVIGHPAAGKALFSKYLAETLGYQFIDTDFGLEHKIGLPIDEILGQTGLTHYESAQEKILHNLSQKQGIVVGLDCHITDTSTVRSMLKNGLVIFLKTTLETQIRRCGSRHETLIAPQHYAQLMQSLQEIRTPLYSELSDLTIMADDGDIDAHIKTVSIYLQQHNMKVLPSDKPTARERTFFKNNTDIPVTISEQQLNCLKLLAKGLAAKEIAREMDISHRTVEVYLAQIKEKLACDSSKELISLYLSKH